MPGHSIESDYHKVILLQVRFGILSHKMNESNILNCTLLQYIALPCSKWYSDPALRKQKEKKDIKGPVQH